MASINFFSEDIVFILKNKKAIRLWLQSAATKEGYTIESINYIFTSDGFLLNMNRQYLDHDTYTDIITFDHAEVDGFLEGDVFISVPRVKENASKFRIEFEHELRRVLIHGLLHLMGYSDKSRPEKQKMTELEDQYLSLLKF